MPLGSGDRQTTITHNTQSAIDLARNGVLEASRSVEALEVKLQGIKREFDDCNAALKAARALEEDAYMKYTQTSSKTFCAAFLHALPRELRDHVYSYLWDDEDIIRQTKRCVREYAWSYRMPEFCAPPHVQPNHVGQVVAEELALSIYKRAFGTKLHVTVSAGHLHKFLAANPLRSTLKPADSIKTLDIEWYPNEYSDEDVARSCRALAIYAFAHPVSVNITIGKFSSTGGDGSTPAIAMADQLSVFKPAYEALVEQKFPVTIKSLSGNEADVQHFFEKSTNSI